VVSSIVLLIGALVGGFWFVLFAVAHVATFASLPVRNGSAVILRLFGLAVVGALLAAAFVPAGVIPGLVPSGHRFMAPLAAGLMMGCCFILYMPLYYAVATSLSIQTVIAIHEAPGRRLALAALAAPDVFEQIAAGRLTSMVRAGNLVGDGCRYRATPKGRRTATTFARLKALWRLGPGG
jgi:hypothetical protein